MVGHSTGGGEVARYLGRHGTKRVAKAALISAITPLMLKTEKNPLGSPIEVFDGLRAALAANRPQFYMDITLAVLRIQPPWRKDFRRHPPALVVAGNGGKHESPL